MAEDTSNERVGMESDQTFQQGRTLLVLSLVSSLRKEQDNKVKNPILEWGDEKIHHSESQP